MHKDDKPYLECVYRKKGIEGNSYRYSGKDGFSENSFPTPEGFGKGYIRFSKNCEGMGFQEFYASEIPVTINGEIAASPKCLKITFLLSNDPIQVGIIGEKGLKSFYPNETYILSADSLGKVLMRPENLFHPITFFIPLKRVDFILEEMDVQPSNDFKKMLAGISVNPYMHCGKVTPALRNTIDHIRSCRMRGSLRSLYLEGKILELAALRFHEVFYDQDPFCMQRKQKLTNMDCKRIREAAEVLESNIEEPPSIQQLARMAGINTSKLKYGFRCVLGNTVFGYINQLRMQKALMLLRDTDRTVEDIALSVGYGSLSSFSTAFKRQFGLNPSSVRK